MQKVFFNTSLNKNYQQQSHIPATVIMNSTTCYFVFIWMTLSPEEVQKIIV